MNRIERAREGAWTAGVLALLLLPVHLFVAPYLRFIEVLCFVGWIFICGVLAIALNDCYKVWWKRSVVEDYGRQHALGVKPRPFVLLLR